jgi:pathogenesis-related protein 1
MSMAAPNARGRPGLAFGFLALVGCAGQAPESAVVPASVQPEHATQRTSGGKMPAGDIRAITAYHNKVRADVGVGPLQWSEDLARYAQQWADHLAATGCNMAHRTQHRYGENLFQGTAGHYTAVDAAKAWETEKKDYAGGVLTEANWQPAGHYTQMVWRDTTTLGCGQSTCNQTLIVACNYAPPGNYIGRRPY